jgi:hypothetical protein
VNEDRCGADQPSDETVRLIGINSGDEPDDDAGQDYHERPSGRLLGSVPFLIPQNGI